ncbi:putative internal virion protein C [Ralstonia phage 10RS306A]|uniref:Internal virion protein C n=1 Tax=Ralstonia phage 10RS306A TaxID=2968818 RepID=A0A977TF88_9CAUD|nr:putative internal virion protein C [Ralstonia phage 10RS306A]
MSANSAYMMWRQFSPSPRVSKGVEAPGYRAQAVQNTVDMRGRSTAGILADFANNASQAFNTYNKVQSDEASNKVQDWMKDKTVDEYRAEMKAGNVPFQDDQVAMAVLHNKAAYTAALQVEQDVEDQIQQGKFKDFNEADTFRIKALNTARGKYAEQFNLTPDNEAFKAGFDRDQEKRREVLLRLQTDVTNKRLQQEGMTVAATDLIAPLPEVMQSFGAEGAAKYIMQTTAMHDKTGLARTDADRLTLIGKAVDSLSASKGGADVLEKLGAESISYGGQDVKLRDLMGGGKFDLAVIQARQAENARDGERFVKQEADYSSWMAGLDDTAAQKHIETLLKESRGVRTPEVNRATEVLGFIKKKQEFQAEQAREQYATQLEKQGRIQGAVKTLSGVLSGTITGGVSADPDGLGLKDREELVAAEKMIVDGLPEGPQRDTAILRLASTVPNGYAFKAVKGIVDSSERDWELMQAQIASGKADVKVPPSVERVQNFMKLGEGSSVLAVNNGKPPAYWSAIEAGTRIGVTPADVAVSQAAWKALPEKERNTRMQALTKPLSNMNVPLNQRNVETLQTFAGHYMAMGLSPESAAKQAEQDFRDQNEVFGKGNGVVHKSFFQFDGSRNSFAAGRTAFDGILAETRNGWGVGEERTMLDYSPDTQQVSIRNVMTGESRPVTQDDVRAKYKYDAEKAQQASKAAVDKTIKQESARQKARSEVTAEERAAAAGVGTVR